MAALGPPLTAVGGFFRDVPGLATLAMALSSINISAIPSSSFSTSSTYTCSVSARDFSDQAAYSTISVEKPMSNKVVQHQRVDEASLLHSVYGVSSIDSHLST